MRYFWLLDREAQKYFKFHYQPGQENLDAITPNHSPEKTRKEHGLFMYMTNFPPIFGTSFNAKHLARVCRKDTESLHT